jgi:2-oxoglutarate ferredoxin oxidoreductase subunit gamma
LYFDLIIAGFGGQGVMFIGNLLAYAGMAEGHKVTYMPVYGVEMRGGTANCTVVVSDGDIGSPIINAPVCSLVMNKPSALKSRSPGQQKKGCCLVNASLIERGDAQFKGPEVMMIPAMELSRGGPVATTPGSTWSNAGPPGREETRPWLHCNAQPGHVRTPCPNVPTK